MLIINRMKETTNIRFLSEKTQNKNKNILKTDDKAFIYKAF